MKIYENMVMYTWGRIESENVGNYPAELLRFFSRIYFFAEAAKLGEARTEAGTYQQLTCSGQTGTAVALVSERSVVA